LLELYTAKSGTKVRLPLNPEAVAALGKIAAGGSYYFWSGGSTRKTCINVWEETFKKMFQRAGIEGHSHQFRHTFAVGLLQKGVSMENVSTLLGHRSLKITERYYASWVAGRQQHLEAEVRRSWKG
jgi:integrase/recombinase XerD